MERPGGGSERAMAWCVDTTKAAGYHHERPRGREVSNGCTSHAGTTADGAKQEENASYLATNGASVETVPFEPLRRLRKERIQAMEAMATDAAMMRGDRTAAPATARRIRYALEYTLVADALAMAAGGSEDASLGAGEPLDWAG